MTIDQFKDDLEPYYSHLDHIVEDLARPVLSERQFKYFEACRFKMKAVWYLYKRVTTFDNQYKQYLSLCISENALDKLILTVDEDRYLYFPFFEALEFENLLSQGKACLDSFSRAIGSIYGQSPKNIDKLLNVLTSKPKDEKIDTLLSLIGESKGKLDGVIVDPSSNAKMSLRDLIVHMERIDIFFSIRMDRESGTYVLSNGAMLNVRHQKFIRFPNYLVTRISGRVWRDLSRVIENCFIALFDDTSIAAFNNV